MVCKEWEKLQKKPSRSLLSRRCPSRVVRLGDLRLSADGGGAGLGGRWGSLWRGRGCLRREAWQGPEVKHKAYVRTNRPVPSQHPPDTHTHTCSSLTCPQSLVHRRTLHAFAPKDTGHPCVELCCLPSPSPRKPGQPTHPYTKVRAHTSTHLYTPCTRTL